MRLARKKSDPPVSLLKQLFLKIIILHQKRRYQSDPIQSDPESDTIRSPIRSRIRSRFCQWPLYRDVVIGWPGSVHDARVLSNSKIFEKGNNTLFPQNVEEEICGQKMNPVIIGDAAYPLLPWLMEPYPENSTTPRIKK